MQHLEEGLSHNQQRLQMLEQAEQKALRLHLYLPNYPIGKLEVELGRIEEQRGKLTQERNRKEKQVKDLRQAIVSEEGIKRFCEIAASNLDNMDDNRWRLLLEAMDLRVFVGDKIGVKVLVPATKKDEDVIALRTSRSGGR